MGTSEPWEDQPHNYDPDVFDRLEPTAKQRIRAAEVKRERKNKKRMMDALKAGLLEVPF